MPTEQIWYDDPGNMFTYDNYFNVLPTQTMTMEERINALVRFFIYLGVILAIIRADYRYLFFGILTGLVSIVIYEYERKQLARVEKFLEKKDLDIVNNKVCVRSTVDNPFMNPTIMDVTENPTRPAACDVDSERVQATIEKNFEKRLFKDVSDLYGNMASQRQFYTVPNTQIPNDQEGFAQWCYGHGPTCKEGNGAQCFNNIARVQTLSASVPGKGTVSG
jgi:hypothetical protein